MDDLDARRFLIDEFPGIPLHEIEMILRTARGRGVYNIHGYRVLYFTSEDTGNEPEYIMEAS